MVEEEARTVDAAKASTRKQKLMRAKKDKSRRSRLKDANTPNAEV